MVIGCDEGVAFGQETPIKEPKWGYPPHPPLKKCYLFFGGEDSTKCNPGFFNASDTEGV